MTNPSNDSYLLDRWHAQKDPDAFRMLCERHAGLVIAACRRQGSPDAAEATQAVFVVLARRAGVVAGGSLCGWLTLTAQRVVLNQRRAAAVRRRHEQGAAVELDRQHAATASEPLWSDARPHLTAALSSLSVGRREAVLRFYFEGKPQAEIATELGCSEAAVKTRVHDGLEGLRTFFTRRGFALGAAALASGLADEASAVDPSLPANCLQAVLNPAGATSAQALAHQVLSTMLIKTSALFASGLLLAASCLMVVLLPAAETAPPKPAPASEKAAAPVTDEERKQLAAGNNQLAFDLLARLSAQEHGNLFFSPFSIRTALAMTYAGARGATAAQMQQMLHFNLSDQRLHAAMGDALTTLTSGGKGGPDLVMANVLWGERSGSFLQPFLQLNQSYYGAGLELVDFKNAPEDQRKRVNGWVAERTQQKILDLVLPGGVTNDTRLLLVNAVFFKGSWADRFDPASTTQEPWAGGDTHVPLMQRRGEYRYAEQRLVVNPTSDSGPSNGLVQILEMPYAGGTASMLVLLPSINTAMDDLVRELTDVKLTAAIAALRPQEVNVGLPRFTLQWGTKDLGPKQLAVLPAMGMKDAFDYQQADFSGIDGTHDLCIDAVFHKAFVVVHEEGTEAAAATAVALTKRSAMPREVVTFRADRPFIFLIREHAAGKILFLGRLTTP